MALSLNALNITPIQGFIDLMDNSSVISGIIDPAFAGTAIVPGQPIQMITTSSGIPKFTALTANTQIADGFAAYSTKDGTFIAGKALEVAISGAVMYMTAGGAIAAGANVEIVFTTNKVITSAGTNPIVGTALDAATADLDIIRVKIKLPTL